MNRIEHLLVCVTEECAEIAQAADKALRFGLEDGSPERQSTNAEDIVKEYSDLVALIRMLFEEGVLKDYNTMTARQIAYKLGFSELNTVRPRLTEMARKGTVEVVGKAYDKATERNVAVYRRVENGN
jgi:hypothetical protein